MYIERFIHDADKSKLHDFLLSEKLTENLVYGYAEQDIVYRRIESEKSYIKMRAKKYVDIKDNIAMITLHNVKRTYRSVMNDMTGQGIRMVCKEKKFLFVHRLWDWLMHII